MIAVAWAWAEDRDEDIFGAPAEEPPAPAEEAPAPAEEPAEGLPDLTLTDSADIAAKLGMADDRLTVGGKLWVRANAYVVEDTDFEDTRFDNPNLLDLFVDARPNDRIRGFAQARLSHDFTVTAGDTDVYGNPREESSVVLDQLWLKFDVGRRLFVTAGRQRIKWGAGRFWNPTDFMNQQALDPLAVFDERTGVGLLKLHMPIESIGANLYALGNIEGADTFDQLGGALRTEWVLGPSELSLSAATRKNQPLRLGADLSAGVGPFDVYVEGAVLHDNAAPHYEGEFHLDTFTFPEEVDRDDEWIPQVVGGAEVQIPFNDEDYVAIGAEYFYNGAGYDDAELYPWLLYEGAYTPFYVGKHYAGAYVLLPGPGQLDDLTILASTLANLSDQSYVSRLQLSVLALTWLNTYVYGQVHYGEAGEFHYSLDLDPLVTIDAPIADVGVGASVGF